MVPLTETKAGSRGRSPQQITDGWGVQGGGAPPGAGVWGPCPQEEKRNDPRLRQQTRVVLQSSGGRI